jgi:hypothetical protein
MSLLGSDGCLISDHFCSVGPTCRPIKSLKRHPAPEPPGPSFKAIAARISDAAAVCEILRRRLNHGKCGRCNNITLFIEIAGEKKRGRGRLLECNWHPIVILKTATFRHFTHTAVSGLNHQFINVKVIMHLHLE